MWLAGACAGWLLVGLVLRLQLLDEPRQFPRDERVWLMVGTSLLERGEPVSWSMFSKVYERKEEVTFDGERQVAVVPYLDHPPLFALGMGVWASLFGGAGAAPLPWAVLRLPMIGVAMLTMVMTAMLVRALWGTTPAVLTLAAFAVFPAHVAASRFVTPESVIALLLVACLYVVAQLDSERDGRAARLGLIFLGLAGGSAVWLKLSGIVVPATVIVLAAARRNWSAVRWAGGATLLSVLLLAAWGAYYDWSAFMSVLHEHSSRPQSFWHSWRLVTDPDLGYWRLRDPALIVGFIGLLGLAADAGIARRARLYVLVPLLNLFLLFLFVAPVEAYGWYRYVWFPLLAMGLGYAAWQLYRGSLAYLILALPMAAVLMEHVAPGTRLQHKVWLLGLYGLLVWVLVAGGRRQTVRQIAAWLLLWLLFGLQAGWGLWLVSETSLGS